MAIQNLRYKVQNILNLPSLPDTAMEVIGMIDNPNTSVQMLSSIISKDQSLASKVLKVANSPFYSYPRVISTIDFAITVLGFETVKELVVSVSFINHFKKYQIKDFNVHKFWAYSIASSIICRELAREINYKIRGEAFITGLIHDIGILIMDQFFPEAFEQLVQLAKLKENDLLTLEEEIFGATHAEIGSWLFDKWNFPPQIVESIKFHHMPSITSLNPQLSALLYYSEYLAREKEIIEFPLESDLFFSNDFLPIITFEKIESLNGFYLKNIETIELEMKKIQYFT